MDASMDERKRSFEIAEGGEQLKRLRPEDILGFHDNSHQKITSRVVLSRVDFSKVIGKSGHTITHIRSISAAIIKGDDVDADTSLVIISGGIRQVLDAFEMITDLVHQSHCQSLSDPFSMELLLEHSKAGKVVGNKGSMIQSLQSRSGARQIKIQKEPKEFHGIQLRSLTIDGTLTAIKRAHNLVLELFCDPATSSFGGGGGGMTVGQHFQQQQQQQQQHGQGQGHGQLPILDSYGRPGGHRSLPVSVPFQNLVSMGLQAETVRQLSEMKTYLSRHFKLDLSIFREEDEECYALQQQQQLVSPPQGQPPMPGHGPPAHLQSRGGAGPYGGQPERARQASANEIVFAVPKACVGAVIGKGGSVLKELQAEFGVRVYVEKDDVNGMRHVVVNGVTTANAGNVDREAMERCRAKVLALVQTQVQSQQQEMSAGSTNNE